MRPSLKPELVAKRHRIFARHYARTGNGSAAARAAGYRRPNEPARLLARPEVQLALAEARANPESLSTIRYTVTSRGDKQRFHFAYLYLELGLHGTAAAKAAGYAGPAYSATLLLRRDDVRQWIARLAQAIIDDPDRKISKALAAQYDQAARPTGGSRAMEKLLRLDQMRKDLFHYPTSAAT